MRSTTDTYKCGFVVVWVPDANLVALGGEATSVGEQPDVTLKSLEDFVPEEWGLPPYESSVSA